MLGISTCFALAIAMSSPGFILDLLTNDISSRILKALASFWGSGEDKLSPIHVFGVKPDAEFGCLLLMRL